MDEVFKRAALAFGKNDHKRKSIKEYVPPTPEQEKEDLDAAWRCPEEPKRPRAKLIWQVRAENRNRSI